VTGSADRTMRQWDIETGSCLLYIDVGWSALRGRPSLSGVFNTLNEPFVGALQFWDYALCSGTADGIIRMWDLRTGQTHRALSGHTGPINCLQFDQFNVISGSQDGTIRIWDLRSGETFDTIHFERPVTSLQFDDTKILCAAGDNEVKVSNISNKLLLPNPNRLICSCW
jgi:division protein 1